MPVSRLDVIYRKILLTKFFTKGWGSPDNLLKLFTFRKIMSQRDLCYELVPSNYPITIINEEKRSDCRIIEGRFRSPFSLHLPNIMSSEVHDAYFQMVLPLKWKSDNYKPICIHLAGTGDHYYWRRRNIMAKPLLKEGIGAIILENPYYGLRKPKSQLRSSLHYVSDIFVMGGCLILECLTLLNWCEKLGFGPLGISGLSMGGHMASLAASNWPKPLVLVPCLSWSTASSVFTEGVMSDAINWHMLQEQYLSDVVYCDVLSKSCKIVDSPFACNLMTRIPEYNDSLLKLIEKNRTTTSVTPHEIVHLLNCSTINHKQSSSTVDGGEFRKSQKERDKEAMWFMRGIMDEFTHLKNFSQPVNTSLIIAVCAQADGYVPRGGIANLEDLWPGATVKYVDTGHVGAYIWYRKVFRMSIVEAFDKAKELMPPPPSSPLDDDSFQF